ncbi:MAG: hypothetical protein FKY71_06495 [Spiribacter salinus]|uniref:Uncharacterized protein n=1 Tax=Spiribacter salinus TaxID=1335746 RepID=A0A540VSX0_9GAMM|nr:MAG: hypothetical protein FKY71_06495 [Spiribacter salinus]
MMPIGKGCNVLRAYRYRYQKGAAFVEYASITFLISLLVWVAFIEGAEIDGTTMPSVFKAAEVERDAYLHVLGDDGE